MKRSTLTALVLGGVIGGGMLLESGTAEAGRVRFGGGARISGRVHWHGGGRVRVRFARPWRPRVWVGGSVWVGGGYYPRPYYYYYPETVPSYYGGTYYPVQPAPTVSVAPGAVAMAPPPPPPLPSFGIGVSAGGSSVQDRQESSDLSLLARLRLTPGLLIEGEVGKTEFEDNIRVDRRFGGSLIWELGARNTFAPYLLGGLGVQQAEVNGGDFTTTQEFGEVGVGLRLALSRNIHLMFDVRAGARKSVSQDDDRVVPLPAAARSVAPPSSASGDDTENYTRARLAAMLYF